MGQRTLQNLQASDEKHFKEKYFNTQPGLTELAGRVFETRGLADRCSTFYRTAYM
jgi:hypothetical protein